MTVPTPGDGFSTGVLTTSDLNSKLVDVLTFLLNMPAAELRQTTVQTLTTSVITSITFTTEDLDDDPNGASNHSTSSNTSRYVAPYSGWYLISGVVAFAANATGLRSTRWAVNGSVVLNSGVDVTSVTASTQEVAANTQKVFLTAGDYVELQAFQSSGGNLNTVYGSDHNGSRLSVMWVRLA